MVLLVTFTCSRLLLQDSSCLIIFMNDFGFGSTANISHSSATVPLRSCVFNNEPTVLQPGHLLSSPLLLSFLVEGRGDPSGVPEILPSVNGISGSGVSKGRRTGLLQPAPQAPLDVVQGQYTQLSSQQQVCVVSSERQPVPYPGVRGSGVREILHRV